MYRHLFSYGQKSSFFDSCYVWRNAVLFDRGCHILKYTHAYILICELSLSFLEPFLLSYFRGLGLLEHFLCSAKWTYYTFLRNWLRHFTVLKFLKSITPSLTPHSLTQFAARPHTFPHMHALTHSRTHACTHSRTRRAPMRLGAYYTTNNLLQWFCSIVYR